ncbi:hypothetical protein JCM6882_009664 [Rhodosporidiobolus microsporus]
MSRRNKVARMSDNNYNAAKRRRKKRVGEVEVARPMARDSTTGVSSTSRTIVLPVYSGGCGSEAEGRE